MEARMRKRLAGLVTTLLLLGATSATATTVYTQTPQSPYSGSGSSPTAAFLQGDFDGDGRADLFQANGDGTYRVFLGRGDGSFQAVPASAPFPTTGGTTPFVSTVGRFNGDALDDVALTHLNSAGVTVLLATGGGAFAAAAGSPFATGNGRAVAEGRLNGDAFADLAFVSQAGELTTLLGDGSGRFAIGFGPFALGSTPLIDVGRIDADQFPDVALGVTSPLTGVQVLLNDGTGRFALAPGGPFATGTRFTSVPHVADLNEDGRGDVTMSHSSNLDNVVSVLLGTGSAASLLAPALGSTFASGAIGPSSTFDPAQLGNDGHLDVVATGTQSQQIAVLQGDGTGRLSLMQGTPFPAAVTSPQSTAIGDYDGNGVNDIAYTVSNVERSLYVLLGRRAAIADRTALAFDPVAIGGASAALTVRLTNTAAFPISFGGASIDGPHAGDFARGTDTCSGQTIPAAGGGCDVAVRFLPSATGARGATLTLPQDGDLFRVALSGLGGSQGPRLTAFSVRPRRFAVAPRGGRARATARRGSRRVARGTTFRATTANATRLVIALDRLLPGRRAGGRCARPTRANRGGRRCVRHVQAGTLAFPVRDGHNTLRWSGRIGRRRIALAPGSYRAVATARRNGPTSRARSAAFTIVRG
ncbi:MAG TPA: FG-GAP-like repeat-containing protein [Conexibacter sp.]|nr:FG-GAP-like repeat-containing protein [Conexibacter sp.]